ncbi:hypothetical protein KKF84_00335 [Myxococcota bacterium]|nr:hypothetical protein [Myxococcota bacterium]
MISHVCRSTTLAFLISVFAWFPAGCDDSGSTKDPIQSLTTTEKADLGTALPSAEQKQSFTISDVRLTEEAPYVLPGSGTLDFIYDAQDTLIGYTRLVNTGVGCHDGACAAIKFILVFDPSLEYVHVFHPAGTTAGEFFKGLDNNTTDSEAFTLDDWDTLYGILADPPTVLLALTDRLDMVDAETGATFEEYQGSVVHNAAYTTYTVLTYILHTREIIQSDFLTGVK